MNIFARELEALLKAHGKTLGGLYTLHSDLYQMHSYKVTRLKQSFEKDITATLNAEEIELVVDWLKLEPEGAEVRRLRAALVAESVRHLLGGRMSQDDALALGEITFRMLLDQEPTEFLALRNELLEGIRGGSENQLNALRDEAVAESRPSDFQADQIEQALEPAIQAYEEGALWLEIARETSSRGARLGYLALARSLLERSKNLATHAPTIAIGTTQQQEWLALIEATLSETVSLR